MNDQLFIFGFLGATGASALALIVMVWLRPAKDAAGWLMAASTVPVFVVVAMLAGLVVTRFRGNFRSGEHFGVLVFCLVTISAILFATGFVWDRVRRRDEER